MQNLTPQKPISKPPIITLVGLAGTGKTTLAAMFPNPVFIQAEESGAVFDSWPEESKPDLFPLLPTAKGHPTKRGMLEVSTREAIKAQIKHLIVDQHNYKTLIIDSASALHRMLEHELCVRDKVDNVADACGGFHKGYIALSDWHGEIMNGLNMLRNRGMAVIILAHTGIQRLKNRPDEDDYTVYSLDMNDKSVPVYVNFSDAVIYIAKSEFVKGKETNNKGVVTKWGKIVQTGERKLITTGDGKIGFVHAKTRYNMPAEIPFNQGENPLLQYISFFNKPQQQNISE
jgi:hypothetical protein